MKRLIVVLAISLLGSSCPAAAAEYLSLDALTTYALANSPELTAAAAAVDSARQIAPQVASLPDPFLGINYQSDTLTPNLNGQLSWIMLSASQEIVLPAKRSLRRQIAEAGAEQATAALRAARSDIVGKITETYINLALTSKKIELLGTRQTLAGELIAAATARYRSGNAEQQDVLSAQKNQYELQLQAEQLQVDAAALDQQLHALSGLPLTAAPLAVHMPEPAVSTQTAAELAQLAFQQSATLAAQKALWDSKLLAVKLNEEERFPDYTLSGGISVAGGMPGMWNAGMQVSIPINLATRQNPAIAQAEAEAAAAGAQYLSQKQTLSAAVYSGYAALVAAKRTLKIYNDGLLTLGKQARTASLSAYATGKNTLSNALEQLNTALDYETGYWEQYAAVLQSQARLQALCNSNLDAYTKKGREQS